MKKCENCNGDGNVNVWDARSLTGFDLETCDVCKGTGLLEVGSNGSEHPSEDVCDCGKCNGTGKLNV